MTIKKKESKGVLRQLNTLAFFKIRMIWFYRNFTYTGRAKYMSDIAQMSIDDLTDYTIHQKRREQFSIHKFMKEMSNNIIITFQKIAICLKLNHIPLFNPENTYRIIFNSILMSYNCFYLIIISLKVFFKAELGYLKAILHEIAMAAWITEMLINMNTSTYHHGQFITDRKAIIKIYLHEYFFFEIIPLIFENLQSDNIWIDSVFKIPLLLKINGIMIIYDKIEFFILHSVKRRYILELVKLIFKLILLTHIMACTYNAFLQFEIYVLNLKQTWADLEQIEGRSWYSDYALAQVWAFTTMCNTTSRQIKTTQEYLFTSFWMLVSCIVFAYIVNKIGSILTEINSQEDQFRDDINLLNQFMKRKHINLALQRLLNLEIKSYYRQEQLKKKIDVKSTLSRLSKPMYKQLMQESYKKVLNMMPYFKYFVSENNQGRIYEIMEEIGYSSHQIIEDNEFDNDISIYYVLKGQFLLNQISKSEQTKGTKQSESFISQKSLLTFQDPKLSKKIPKPISIIKEGECFGTYEFLTGQKKQYVAESSKLSFLDIIRSDEEDYQNYMQCKDKLIFNKQCHVLQQQCYSCGQSDHYFIDCINTHFNKNNPFIIPKHNYNHPQMRNPVFLRKPRTQQHVIFKQNEEDDEYSEKSSVTLLKNDRTQDYENVNYQHSQQDSDRELESKDLKIVSRGSNHLSNRRTSVQNQQDIFDDRISQEKIMDAFNAIQGGLTRNLSFQDDSYISPKMIIEQLFNDEIKDDQIILDAQNKMKQIRRKSKQFQHPLKNSAKKRGSVEELNPIMVKNCVSMIEEIKETERENDSQIFDLNQQNGLSQNYQVINGRNQNINGRGSEYLNPLQLIHHGIRSTFNEHPSYRRIFIEWNDSLDYWKFDKAKQTKFYFPESNYKLVLKKLIKMKQKGKPRSKNDKILNMQSSQFKRYTTYQKNKSQTPKSYQCFQTKVLTFVQNE